MGHSPSHMYEPLQRRYSNAQFKSERTHCSWLRSHLSSICNKWLLMRQSWDNGLFVWGYVRISQKHTKKNRYTHTLQVYSTQPNNTQKLAPPVSHPGSTFTCRGQPVCFSSFSLLCGFSHCSKALCQSVSFSLECMALTSFCMTTHTTITTAL